MFRIFLINSYILFSKQHRFRLAKFAVTSDVSFLSFFIESVECGHQIDVIITNFIKAFVTIHFSLFNINISILFIYHLDSLSHTSKAKNNSCQFSWCFPSKQASESFLLLFSLLINLFS